MANYWNDFSKNTPEVFNGDVISVFDIRNLNGYYNITINIIKYCDVIYSKMVGNIKTRALFSGGYILTNDNYIGFVIDKNNIVNLVGGMTSTEDFINDKYDSNLCMTREFKEEIGLDINSDKFDYSIVYIKYPKDSEDAMSYYPVGLIYEIKTDYSKDESNDLFNNLKHDNEINSILFLKFDEHSNLGKYLKKDYIDELYNLIINKRR